MNGMYKSIKLKNGYNLTGFPNRIEYKRNDNGKYTLFIKDYMLIDENGERIKAQLQISNVDSSEPLANEGVIQLSLNDVKFFGDLSDETGDFWKMIIPENIEIVE